MSWCLFGEYGNAIVKSNFVNNHIRLNGNVHGHKLRLCNKCEEMKPPEGWCADECGQVDLCIVLD